MLYRSLVVLNTEPVLSLPVYPLHQKMYFVINNVYQKTFMICTCDNLNVKAMLPQLKRKQKKILRGKKTRPRQQTESNT